jgi:hypothetical protein
MLMPCFQQTLRILNMQSQSATPQINTEHPWEFAQRSTLITLRIQRAPQADGPLNLSLGGAAIP